MSVRIFKRGSELKIALVSLFLTLVSSCFVAAEPLVDNTPESCGSEGTLQQRIDDCRAHYPQTSHQKGNLRDNLTSPPAYYYWTLVSRIFTKDESEIQLWLQDESGVLWTSVDKSRWTWKFAHDLAKIYEKALGLVDPALGNLKMVIPLRKTYEQAFEQGLDKILPQVEALDLWTSTSWRETRSEWVYSQPRITDPPRWIKETWEVDRCVYLKPGKTFGEFDYTRKKLLHVQFVGRWKPAPKDSDGDGVVDTDDYCPHTPSGLKAWTVEQYHSGQAERHCVGCAGGTSGDVWDGKYIPPQDKSPN